MLFSCTTLWLTTGSHVLSFKWGLQSQEGDAVLLGMNKALPSLRQGGWAQGQGYMAGVGFKVSATDRDPVANWAGEGQDREAGQEGEGARGRAEEG